MEVSIMVNDKIEAAASEKQRHVEESLRTIREAMMHLRFGTISLTVDEDQVVQIDVTDTKQHHPSCSATIGQKRFYPDPKIGCLLTKNRRRPTGTPETSVIETRKYHAPQKGLFSCYLTSTAPHRT